MPIIDPAAIFSPDTYWRLVRATIKDIFDGDQRLADKLQKEQADLPIAEQILSYHAEPLDVAADLTGTELADDHVTRYRKLAAQHGRS